MFFGIHNVVNFLGRARIKKRLACVFAMQDSSNGCNDLEVFVRLVVWRHDHDHQPNRNAVLSAKIDGRVEQRQYSADIVSIVHFGVRHGDTAPQCR